MLSSGGSRVGILLGEALGNCISLDGSPSKGCIGGIRLRGWWSGCHGWAGDAVGKAARGSASQGPGLRADRAAEKRIKRRLIP